MSRFYFEEQLWNLSNKLRNSMNPSEYQNIIMGLVFLKYISDVFNEIYIKLLNNSQECAENPEEYKSKKIFWLPYNSRWSYIANNNEQSKIGEIVDDALYSIERENEDLRGILPKIYSRPEIDKYLLSEIIRLFCDFEIINKDKYSEDFFGQVYEYFLGKFSESRGGEFYTPKSVVNLMIEMIQPYEGKIYDPCCGSGSIFVQCNSFSKKRNNSSTIEFYGQEWNASTWKLAKMNLIIRRLKHDLGSRNSNTFLEDLHPKLKADYILANPPFNAKDWNRDLLLNDKRWRWGLPPKNNANYAWLSHIISKLSTNGVAAIVLTNGSLSSSATEEILIRKNIIDADLVECIVALPDKLFIIRLFQYVFG